MYKFPPSFEDRSRAVIEILAEIVVEILIQFVGELFAEFGIRSVGDALRHRDAVHPVLAGLGIVILGLLGGALASLVWPSRIFRQGPLPGASLLVSPLLNGFAMERFGRWRETRGRTRSHISTGWGGALFAFAMALVRFAWVGM